MRDFVSGISAFAVFSRVLVCPFARSVLFVVLSRFGCVFLCVCVYFFLCCLVAVGSARNNGNSNDGKCRRWKNIPVVGYPLASRRAVGTTQRANQHASTQAHSTVHRNTATLHSHHEEDPIPLRPEQRKEAGAASPGCGTEAVRSKAQASAGKPMHTEERKRHTHKDRETDLSSTKDANPEKGHGCRLVFFKSRDCDRSLYCRHQRDERHLHCPTTR